MNKPALITAGLFGACIFLMVVFQFLNWLTKRRLKRLATRDLECELTINTKEFRQADPPPPYTSQPLY